MWDSKIKHSIKRERSASRRKGNALMNNGGIKFLAQVEARNASRDRAKAERLARAGKVGK
jgi:hypothetical protein